MKWNESGINSLEIVIIVLMALGILCLLSGVFIDNRGRINDNNSVQER